MISTAHRYFLEVVRTGTIKAAAACLHVAPSAVSRQIAKLEESCGARLFERRPHGMVTTQAGEMLANHARRVSMESEHVLRDIRGLRRTDLTTIRIGSNEAVARNILPELLGAYRTKHPDVIFQVQVASPGMVAQRLRERSIDVGIAFSLKAGSDIEVRYEISSPVRAIMAPTHPLVAQSYVSLEDLRRYPLALTETGTTVHLLFNSVADDEGPPIEIAYTSNSSSVIRAIVEAGHAVTLAGEITLAEPLRRNVLVARPLEQQVFTQRTLQVQIARDAVLPEAIDIFVRHLMTSIGAQ